MVNIFIGNQPLDILTMLWFVILAGVVVNKAILIVNQALNNIRCNDMPYREAVLESTRTRLQPIFMSTTTSIFGMLPLVLVPGPGYEFYRGLGSVVLGALAISTLFTIFVIPSMLMFFIKMEKEQVNFTDSIPSAKKSKKYLALLILKTLQNFCKPDRIHKVHICSMLPHEQKIFNKEKN